MIYKAGHGVRMRFAAPGWHPWWWTSPVSVHSYRQGVRAISGQRGTQGQEVAAYVLPLGQRGAFCGNRWFSRLGPKKRSTRQVSVASLAGPHRMERLVQARLVREDHEESSRCQDSRGNRKRPRQDLSWSGGLRRQKEKRISCDASSSLGSFSECRVLSGYELRSWLHPHGCRTCSRCTQGCIFAARADDGKVPSKSLVLRRFATPQVAYVSVSNVATKAFSRCSQTLSRPADHAGVIPDKVDTHNFYTASELLFSSACLGSHSLRRITGRRPHRIGNRQAAKKQDFARRN
mmetsp:Transcript_45534/g.99169  ORF Transcript_45534/g.99169 Transcript_45534/m.99169 type:complete len:291 (-) Transcript_45534:1763-2635(-)